jgi:DNA repair exonuclease SbcCD ATPase subunit
MIKHILWATAVFMLAGFGSAFAQDSPEEVHQKVTKTITTESKAQEKADDWNWEKDPLLSDIRDLKYRITWKQYRQQKYRNYIKGVEESIERLKFQEEEINRLREQLEPYLEQVVDRLETFVKNDLPFLPDERQKRIDNLRASLNSYTTALSEKLRRVFAIGLQPETQYGRLIEAEEDVTLNINGIETQVTLFRLARLAKYYMTIDGRQIGMWNRESGQWESVSDDQLRAFKLAFDIALKKKSVEIVELPLGAI